MDVKNIEEDKIKEEKIEEDKIKEGKIEEEKIEEDKIKEEKIKEEKIEEDKIEEEKIKDKKSKERKKILSPRSNILLMLLISVIVTIIMFALQTDEFADVWNSLMGSCFLAFFLNCLPIFLAMLLLYFITNNFSISVSVVSILMIILALINRFKIMARQYPFTPWDIMMGDELLGIAKNPPMRTVALVCMFLFVSFVCSAVAFHFIKNNKMKWQTHVIGIIAVVSVAFLCNNVLYHNRAIFRLLPVTGSAYNPVNQYNSKGFLYSFIYAHNISKITPPPNYSEKEMEEFIASFPVEEAPISNENKPHVIMIMGEAYSEIASSPVLSYEGYEDPMYYYNEMKKESYYGEIVVPNVGGGTADTEFDVLTGINTRHFRGRPYSYMMIKEDFPSFVSVLNDAGYANIAIHPGYDWFYNRENVYSHFGFSDFLDVTHFDKTQKKSSYISEEAVYDRIIEEFEKHLVENPDQPFFEFCVTIQNHRPFEDKYGVTEPNFNSSVPLSEEDANILANYIIGVEDANEELWQLFEYAKVSEEPIVIVYFGDHLPGFSEELFDALIPTPSDPESLEGQIRLNKTPYLVWANEPAKGILPAENSMPENGSVFSSFYLGAAVLSVLGLEQTDPFFTYIDELHQKYPVILGRSYATPDGQLHEDTDENEDINLYKSWEYYKLQ